MEKGYDHAHKEDDCHESGEGDYHRHELEEQKQSSMREEAYRLEQKREGAKVYQS